MIKLVSFTFVCFLLFESSTSILLPDSPRLKTENGHLILESANDRNVSLRTRGSGSVMINGVDVTASYLLLKNVEPQLETLRTSDLNFLISNLSRVVQTVSSETHLAETLNDFRTKLNTAKDNVQTLTVNNQELGQKVRMIEINITELSSRTFTEEDRRMIRNITNRMASGSSDTSSGSRGGSTSQNYVVRNIKRRVQNLESQVSDLSLLEERVSSLEYSSGNGTLGTAVGTRLTRDVRTLKRQVRTLKRKYRQLRTAVLTDDCDNNPCHNGGTCIDNTRGFVCLCPSGFEGHSCSEDVNECVEFIGTDLGCQNGATCSNVHGSYSCFCSSGWYGVHCNQKTDSCITSSSRGICGHGTCIPTAKDGHEYTCLCDQGWTKVAGNPACIHDVNECLTDRPPCSQDPLVQCINNYGSFRCGSCPQGFEGNGFVCRDVDECATYNGGCSLVPRVECINTRPSRRCGSCPPGYFGDGVTCNQVVGPCTMIPCHPLATCHDNPQMSSSYFTCTCPYGYSGNGMGQMGCMRTPGGGAIQPSNNPCASNPCLHGTCAQQFHNQYQYICSCLPGYTGINCNQALDMCASSPCLNGGTCTSAFNSFTCSCPSSHSGDLCQTRQRSCGGRLAGHGGEVDFPGPGQATYQHNISCSWIIRVNRTLVISVNFSEFHLEPSLPSCRYDWLQIHDGARSSSHLLGRFCGRTKPGVNGTFSSTHNYLYLWFRSDHSRVGSGFKFTWNAVEPVCGGDIRNREHGSINSPGYPGNYPSNRDCYWTITTSPGKKIQFAFATLEIEHHANCSFDYLMIRDGLTEDDTELARYCSSQTPAPIVTSGSEAFIHFHTDSYDIDKGFHITYVSIPGIPGCGGLITGDLGEFSVPTLSDQYAHNIVCEWEIRVPQGEFISLNFTQFTIERHRSCLYDYVEVRDGGARDSTLIGRFCGYEPPATIRSTGNQLFVVFKSDSSLAHEGFTARYEVACGGEFTAETGILKSPFHPNNYPHNRMCIYVIKQPVGKAIILNFTSFDLEDSHHMNCYFDYLEVRDGLRETSPLMGRYCGPDHRGPSIMVSTLNAFWLKFKTDGSVSNKGFLASYSTIDITCGGIHHDLAGTISSPNSPDNYPGNTDCRWVLDMPPGHFVQLTWHSFSLESHSSCSYDYVEVFDNSTVPNIGGMIGGRRYCGTTLPPVMTSMDNVMTIHFHSDSSMHRDGFSATYHGLDATRACGGDYHTSSGRIRSPNYPNNYPNRRTCSWKITVPFNSQIKLNFTHFNLEVGGYFACDYDSLTIRNGGYETSPVLQTLCGNSSVDNIFSHSHQLYIEFKSDPSLTRSGFELFWSETATGCGGTLTSVTGELMSPGYPMLYNSRSTCIWKIRINKGSKISLHFIDLDMITVPSCYLSYLEVRDGGGLGSPLIRERFCTSQELISFNSTSNEMTVKFSSSGIESNKRGFRARYYSDCSTVIQGRPAGIIESPNYPRDYPHDRNCTWTIKAPKGNSVNASFSHFEIEDPAWSTSGVCEYDFVEIRVGRLNSPTRVVKGHFCGDRIPPLVSSGTGMEVMEIQFVSDISIAHNGFRLEWAVYGCGGVFRRSYGSFSSPNFPNHYPVNTVCEWHIIAYPGLRIQITIEEYDIESSFTANECDFDSLVVYGGPDKTSPKLLTLCHHEDARRIVTTQGGNALVTLESDGSVRGKGFRATYHMLAGGCGGRFTATRGEIHSPGYPSNYDSHSDCTWKLETDENHVVELEFKDFDIEPHSNCSYDYVSIYDGSSISSPVISQHCGSVLPVPSVIRSSGRYMTVRLKADESATGKGFKAEYRRGCGATIEVPNEIRFRAISSPNFPKMFNSDTNCTWHLKSPEGMRIILTMTHLSIHQNEYTMAVNESCSRDYVAVYNGDTIASPQIGLFCGTHVPLPLYSSSEYLTVHLETGFGHGVGFRALYATVSTICGGDFSSISGEFGSPNYPESYPTSYECIYTIHAGEGNKILLSFQVFNFEESEGCNSDYLEVHERDPAGTLLLHACGATVPETVEATGVLWIKFKSDDQGTAAGFLATYTIASFNELSGTSGVIESPLYPQLFTGMREFSWKIIVPSGSIISIRVIDLSIEVNPVEDVCFSSLVIHEGPSSNSRVKKTLCGYSYSEGPIVVRSRKAFVRFIANYRHEGSSFKIRYEAVDYSTASGIVPVHRGPHPNCTFLVYVNGTGSTIFTSPNYPENYDNGAHCEWIIQADVNSKVQLDIRYELEEHSRCVFDKIEIYDGMDGRRNWNKTDTLCRRNQLQRNRKKRVTSSGRYMRIVFKTDMSVTKKGFNATVTTVCGGILTDPDGVIKSPNYPSNYVRAFCQWKVIVSRGRTIKFVFDDFRVENTTSSCRLNALMIFNGETTSSPYLGAGRFCGTSVPPNLETSSNTAFLSFIGYAIAGSKGFHITYQELSGACGGRHLLSNEVPSIEVQSPNYPEPSDPHTQCTWIITGPIGKTITAHFEEPFKIPWSRNCESQSVAFHDGGTELSHRLQRLCGNQMPNTLTTTDNVLLIKYSKNVDYFGHFNGHGFKVTVHAGKCGGTYKIRDSVLSSPNYPEPYDNIMNCTWHIIGQHGHFLQFQFIELNIYNPSTNCTSSTAGKFSVYDPIDNSTRSFCSEGPETPSFNTIASNATVTFTNNGTGGGINRFRIRVRASLESCGGEFSGTEGVIKSPGYPHGMSSRRYWCSWKITGPPGTRIKLTFEDLEITGQMTYYNVTSCWHEYIRVKNGLNFGNKVPTIGTFCGSQIPDPVSSSMNEMTVVLFTYRPRNLRGFKARWTTTEEQECGGVLAPASGVITPPVNNLTLFCSWTIMNPTSSNSSIKLDVIFLRLQSNCQQSITIRGVLPSGEEGFDRKICNGELETHFELPYPTVKIIFTSSVAANITAFNMSYGLSNCGGYHVGPQNNISSPNYPNLYPANSNCSWFFNYERGNQIEFNFTYFRLEDSANHDFVKLLNGPHWDSPVIGHYTGSNNPGLVGPSMSNQVLFNFQSDSSTNNIGFAADVWSHSRGCGGILHGINGDISSPGFLENHNYPANIECVWEVRVSPGYMLDVEFVERFDLETSDDCVNDFVQISLPEKSRGITRWVPRERQCGKQLPPAVNTNSSAVKIMIRSNGTVEGGGFKVHYYGVCGGVFKEKTGVVVSPGYPTNYLPNLNCKYTIDAPSDSYVILNFTSISIEPNDYHHTCYDKLKIEQDQIRYGRTRRVVISTLCGTTLPDQLSLRGPVYMTFTSDYYSHRSYNGFMIHYKIEDCGGNLTESTEIGIPPINGRVSHSTECVWDIQAPEGKIIHYKFQALKLGLYNRSCYWEHVTIYEGLTENVDKIISKFCGDHSQDLPILTSRTSSSRLVLSSPSRWRRPKFRVAITFQQKCGEIVNISNSGDTHTIRSLDTDGDGNYEPSLTCQWLIQGHQDRVVALNFTRLDIEGPNENDTIPCPYDFIRVYDGPSTWSPEIGVFCGSSPPSSSIISSHNIMLVTFISDSVNQTSGFTAIVGNIPRLCGAPALVATNAEQTLESPNYPADYPALARCVWTITTPNENDRINVRIDEIHMQTSVNCEADNLYISDYDGVSQLINTGAGRTRLSYSRVNFNGREARFSFGNSIDHNYCDEVPTHHLITTKNGVRISFTSDATIQASGFRIHFSIAKCNTTYVADSAVMTRRSRDHSDNCSFTITVGDNQFVSLYFSYLHVSAYPRSANSFKVYNGTDSSGTAVADFQGYLNPDPIFSSGSSLHVKTSGSRVSYRINYAASDKANGCGGKFFGKSSVITSPNYPGVPARNLTCIYTIAVRFNSHAAIRFSSLDFGGGGGCNSTYLELYDVLPSNEARLFTTLCETDDVVGHLSPTNRLIVRYVTGSTADISGTGWRAVVLEASPSSDTNFDLPADPTTESPQ